jgi:membrane protease YdiL (CAAX protease family)
MTEEEARFGMTRVRRALVAGLVVAAAWNLLGNLVVPDAWYVAFNLLGALVVVGVGRWCGLSNFEMGVRRADVGKGAIVGLAAAVVVTVVLGMVLAIPLLEVDDITDASDATRWYRTLVRIPLGTVVFEELLFRSLLFGVVQRLHDARLAVVTTSVLFGFWHVVPAWESADGGVPRVVGTVVVTVVVTTAAGIAFALLRHYSSSVVGPIMAHTATNSFAYAAAIVALEVLR